MSRFNRAAIVMDWIAGIEPYSIDPNYTVIKIRRRPYGISFLGGSHNKTYVAFKDRGNEHITILKWFAPCYLNERGRWLTLPLKLCRLVELAIYPEELS